MAAGDVRPVPDPTELTTDALRREISSLRELVEKQLDVLRTEMHGRWAVDDERYASVGRRFAQAEAIRLEQKNDTTKSIEAALLVVRQENERIEIGVTKQIEAERATSIAARDGLTAVNDGLKERVTALESVRRGGSESRASLYAGLAAVVSLLLIAVTVLPLLAGK